MQHVKIGALVVGLVIAATSLAGCTSLGLFQTPEERVERRAQARLDALLAQDFKEAFSFLAPATRKATTLPRWATQYAGVAQWRAVKVNSVNCEPDRCDVSVAVTYELVRPRINNTNVRKEVWIDVNGQWYYYPKQG